MSTPVAALERPHRLVPGDRVAVVAPSGPATGDRLGAGLEIVRGWGLEPVVAPSVSAVGQLPYLAGEDAARARDLEDAWCDPSVAAVLCARGGFGAQRIVELLDWGRMRAVAPKPFVGFSDATALHEAFATRIGVATLYGPMVAAEVFISDRETQEHLRATLFEPETTRTLSSPTARTLVAGRATGVTVGGCLTLLAAELGTPGARPSAAGGVLVLEDVGVEPYELDRALTQLLRSGWLDGVAGIVLGSWAGYEPYDELRAVLDARLGALGRPVVEEFGFGHGPSALTVPLGLPCQLDAKTCTLRLDLPALA